jgi:hypothetical protein
MRARLLRWGMAAALQLLGACAEIDPNVHAQALAAPAGLVRGQVPAGRFILTAFSRMRRPDQPLTIYIEGDGLAWFSRDQPSDDPTPRQAMGLVLAAADPAANVVYLARPCQFTPMALNPECQVAYWTGKRYAPEVVDAMDQAVTHFAAQVPGQAIHLVGYSGGGALAVILAARRHDVASIRTVAGNLDMAEVNRLHQVSAMPESENAIDFAGQVSHIAQIHFSGADDSVVPSEIARRFIAATGGRCAQLRVVPDMAHDSDWGAIWPGLLTQIPRCD